MMSRMKLLLALKNMLELTKVLLISLNNLMSNTRIDWVSKPALATMMKIVCSASNKVFVGLPLCNDNFFLFFPYMSTNQEVTGRNKDYMDLNIRFTIDVVKAANTIKPFPDIVKP